MRSSNPTFSSARSNSADAHTLALIASSLVAATAIAFLAMVLTAWPARAAGAGAPMQVASLGSLPMPAEPCADRLAAAEAEINRSLASVERLHESDMGAQCSAFRGHLVSLGRAVDAVDRCVAGPERAAKIGFLRQSATEWRGVISHGCR
ncbi:hypothetical protein ACJ4V0_19485 [Phreatobacter sp. HK31-P]